MIRHSYRRTTGDPESWRRYDSSDRAAARIAEAEGLPATLYDLAVSAMTDPTGIEAVADVLFEIESNRLRRDTVDVSALVDGAATTALAGDLSLLASGRYSPAVRYGIADTERGRLDDGAIVYAAPPVGWGDDSKPATVFASSSGATTPLRGRGLTVNGSAQSPNPIAGVGRWVGGKLLAPSGTTYLSQVDVTNPAGSSWMVNTYPDPANPGETLTRPFTRAWRLEAPAGQTLDAVGVRALFPSDQTPTRYRFPASGELSFYLAAYVASKDVATSARMTVFFDGPGLNGGTGGNVWTGGFTHAIPARPAGAPVTATRVQAEVTVAGVPGTEITLVRPWLEFGAEATGIEASGIQVYAGTRRPDESGVHAAVPAKRLDVVETFFADTGKTIPSTRQVNRVEVAGELHGSRVTAASVDVKVDGAWIVGVGSGNGNGRLSIELDDTYRAQAVRVGIEEVGSGHDGPVYVTEVDPRLVEDVTDEVAGFDVEWSRETDPGAATTPVGNYEASTLSLELDDTAGRWNPARNASLDVGHRIEVATGVRYRNVSPNPYADRDVAGWWRGATGSNPYRVAKGGHGLDDAAPYGTAVAIDSTGGQSALYGPSAFSFPGNARRLGLWVRIVSADPTATVTFDAYARGGTAQLLPALDRQGNAKPRPVARPGDGWVYLEVDSTFAGSGNVDYLPALAGVSNGGATHTVYVTGVRSTVFDDGATRATERVFEELVSAGVFYSEPYETDSDSPTVSIQGVDRLSRVRDAAVDEPVRIGQSVARIVRDLALRLLDFDEDQVAIHPTSGEYAIPYAYPSGGLGSYLADLAKATLGTLHVDPLERLVLAPRADVSGDVVAEIRADNALISFKRPPSYDTTASVVTVNAGPLETAPVEELWSMPAGGVTIAAGALLELVAPYGEAPAVNGYAHGLVADGDAVVEFAEFYSDRAVVRIRNNATSPVSVADLRISGNPLVERPISARRRHDPSVRRYGEREFVVDAKLVQTQGQADAVAEVLLDAFRGVDDAGVRRLPDLSFSGLGLLHVTAGDRIVLADPDRFLGAEYAVLSRKLTFEEGAILLDDVRVRESTDVVFAIVDEDDTDSGAVAGY